MILRRKLVTMTSVTLLAVAMSACASSASGAAGVGSPAATAAATHGAPIKIGLQCSCSGAGGFGAFLLPVKKVLQSWVDTVNHSGGINGHKVQLITEDDAGNPGTATTQIKTLISDHVVAIADASLDDPVFATTVAAAKIPVVGVETPNGPFGTNADFYPEGQTNASAIYAVLKTAKEAGATNLANVYCAESPDCAKSVPYFQSTGKKLGIPVTYNAEISATAPNYTAQCVAAKQQNMKSVFIGDASVIIAKFGTDCSQQGYNPVYVTEGAGFGMVEATAPGLKDNLWNEFPAMPFFAKTKVVKNVEKVVNKHYPGLTKSATYSETAFMAWVSGTLLKSAIRAGHLGAKATPSAAEVTHGLNKLKPTTLGGLTVPLSFKAGQPHNINCWFTTQVKNGVPKLVNHGHYTCEK